MEYVTDSQGQIMVRDQKGNTKYFHKNMVDNLMLMNRHGFTPVPKPVIESPSVIEPIVADVTKVVEVAPLVSEEVVSETDNTVVVAEASAAKRRGRPPLKK